MGQITTNNYDVVNAQNAKEPVIILDIDGLPFIFSSQKVYTTIRYDDPGVYYDGTYNYDGLRPLDSDKQKNLIDRAGSFSTISQKLEQWDGKASVETCNIKLIDKDNLVTQVCTPGYYFEEIINRKVRVFYGFKNISYPEDYLLLFKGYVNNVDIGQGFVNFTFTDPSSKRKQVLFNATSSKLTNSITDTDTILTVSSTDNFYKTITDAKGNVDSTVTIGLVLDNNEIVTYTNAGITSTTTITVIRGQYGTTAVAHAADIEIKMFLGIIDNPINIALKSQLSGWNAPWTTGIGLRGIVNTDDGGTTANTITFNQGVDLVRDYGLNIGDYIILSGSPNPSNNTAWTISDLINENRTVKTVETGLIQENPNVATLAAFRSKYDVYPVTAGLSLTTDDVFTSQWEYVRDTFVKFNFNMDLVAEESSGKTWIETHLLKPIGAYSLTQGARISVGITHPPLANDLTKFIDPTNVIDPKGIMVSRGLNSRFFYNEVNFNYKYDALNQSFSRSLRFIDADAQNRMDQVAVLDLDMRGLDDSQTSIDVMTSRSKRILQRYKFSAETIKMIVNFGTGHTIDAGDVVVLNDTSTPILQIADTSTGSRGLLNKIMEVQERSIGISKGQTSLTLLSNNGFSFSDRYGVVGPASNLDPAFTHTTTTIRIIDSFSIKFPGAEYKKWEDYQGSIVRIHTADYSTEGTAAFTLDSSDPYIMHLTPALSITPNSSMVVEFEKYDDTSALTNALVKSTFVHQDPASLIASASSSTVFVVQSGYGTRYLSGMIVYVISPDGTTRKSPDVKIVTVVGDVITIGPILIGGTNSNLGFTPVAGDIMQLAGFKDLGSGYRYV